MSGQAGEREAFEKWAESCHLHTRRDGDTYFDKGTKARWVTWQAARAAAWIPVSERLPELGERVLVVDDHGVQYSWRIGERAEKAVGWRSQQGNSEHDIASQFRPAPRSPVPGKASKPSYTLAGLGTGRCNRGA